MNIERDKAITKAMGECYHEFDPCDRYNGVIWPCKHCGDEYLPKQIPRANSKNNFSTWPGFGKLVTWMKDHPELGEMLDNNRGQLGLNPLHTRFRSLFLVNIDPNKLADAVYDYLKGELNG